MRVLGLAEDRGAVPSTTQGLRTIHNFSFSEPDAFFLPPWVPGMHRVDTDTWRQIPCAYKIKQINVIKVFFFFLRKMTFSQNEGHFLGQANIS